MLRWTNRKGGCVFNDIEYFSVFFCFSTMINFNFPRFIYFYSDINKYDYN